VLYSEYSQGISLALDGSGQAHIAYRQQWYDESWLQYIVWSNQLNDWTRYRLTQYPMSVLPATALSLTSGGLARIATFLYGSPTTPTYFYETAPNQWSSEAFGPAGGIYVEPSVGMGLNAAGHGVIGYQLYQGYGLPQVFAVSEANPGSPDVTAPAAVTDAAGQTGRHTAIVTWTAPGDDGSSGPPRPTTCATRRPSSTRATSPRR